MPNTYTTIEKRLNEVEKAMFGDGLDSPGFIQSMRSYKDALVTLNTEVDDLKKSVDRLAGYIKMATGVGIGIEFVSKVPWKLLTGMLWL